MAGGGLRQALGHRLPHRFRRRRRAGGSVEYGRHRGIPRDPGVADQYRAPFRSEERLDCAHGPRRLGPGRGRRRRPRHRPRGLRQRALARAERHARAHGLSRRVARDRQRAARRHPASRAGADGARRRGTNDVIRVLVADDHNIVRDGLKRILASTSDVQVAAEAASGDEALALVKANEYDLVMLDMSMPGLSGIDLIKRLRIERPSLRILVLSMHGEQQYAARALKAGASGYLNKDSAAEMLLGALRKIAGGGVHISD